MPNARNPVFDGCVSTSQELAERTRSVLLKIWKRRGESVLEKWWRRWMFMNRSMREEEMSRAELCIQRHVRGCMMRRRYRVLRAAELGKREKKEEERRKTVRHMCEQRSRAARQLQKVMRGWYQGRRVVRRMRIEDRSACIIQRLVRRIQAKRKAW